MKIIGISGGSGAGKSTATKELLQILPNCLYICPDVYLREETELLQNAAFQEMDKAAKLNYIFRSYQSMTTWIDYVKDKVVSRIKQNIEQNGKDKDYVVIEWCFLPMCDYYKECDYTLCIKTDYQLRYDRLIGRLKNVNSFSIEKGSPLSDHTEETLANRLKFTALEEHGYKAQYEIVNNGDMESFNNDIKGFATAIIDGNNVVSKFYKF